MVRPKGTETLNTQRGVENCEKFKPTFEGVTRENVKTGVLIFCKSIFKSVLAR